MAGGSPCIGTGLPAAGVRSVSGAKCESCRRWRPFGDLLAFFPHRDPTRRGYVCRPTLDVIDPWRCFRNEVTGAAAVAIEPAEGRQIGRQIGRQGEEAGRARRPFPIDVGP